MIAPFSELARFYDNTKDKTFDALIKSLKGIEGTKSAQDAHQRIYIPIVGLEEKMQTFKNESQIATAYMKLLFPHWDKEEEIDKKAFDLYCLQSALHRRGIVKEQCHYIDSEFKARMPEVWVI